MFLDREELKFAILYTMKRYVEPMDVTRLQDLLNRELELLDYFKLSELLDELMEVRYIREVFYKNEQCYELTKVGLATNEFFFERIPGSVRKKIEKQVSTVKFGEQADPNAIHTEILPTAPQQYMASLQMLDAGDPILELKLFAGSRAQAEKMAKKLKTQAYEIYQGLVDKLEDKKGDESNE